MADVTSPISLSSSAPAKAWTTITIVLSDRTTELTGTVRERHRQPLGGLTVIAFSSDEQYWRPSLAEIQAVRTDQSGAFMLRNLPAGDYDLAVVDDVEQGEWYDPSYLQQLRPGGKRISLSEGEKKTQDLKGPS